MGRGVRRLGELRLANGLEGTEAEHSCCGSSSTYCVLKCHLPG